MAYSTHIRTAIESDEKLKALCVPIIKKALERLAKVEKSLSARKMGQMRATPTIFVNSLMPQ